MRGPIHKGLCGAPRPLFFSFILYLPFQLVLECVVLSTKYLANIQHFNILESLDLFFSTIKQLLVLKLIVIGALIAQS